MTELPLYGQVALVTGAAKRIGRSIALRLAAAGADLVVNYQHSAAEAEEVGEAIRRSGRRAFVMAADVGQSSQVRQLFGSVESEFGRLDILVNNAGVYFDAPFESLTEEQWDFTLNTNLKSQYLCAQAALPLMRRAGRGRIVNLSSIGAFQPKPSHVHYCVSKAGVVMMTRCLARALGPEITVNSVAPGKIQFPGEEIDQAYVRRTPLAKVGTGEDIAETVLFLVQAEFITGQVILVDGGRMLT
ncbi:MAG TPA: SDR family NAD(P)-dependent oxidoreductase [Candidatus Dormibacteraeota bacterium]|nr:SDR family NAD(P)-dependent oxidoreductase [Candidatus Dormibacteraeota bacterium]